MSQWNRELALLFAVIICVFFVLNAIRWIFVNQQDPEPWWWTIIAALVITVVGALYVWATYGIRNK